MTAQSSDNSDALYERALKVLPGGNSRTTVFELPHPPYAARGEGCRLYDVDGREYLDFVNNYTSLIHGHAQPDVIAAVRDQLERGSAFPFPTESEIRLAEMLCERVPGFDLVRYVNSGSEAVMTAIKAARAFTDRPRIAKCEGSYHGSYDFAEVSLDSTPETWGNAEPKSVAYARGTPRSVLDNVVVIPFNKPDEAEAILRANADSLAAVLIDPMPNRGGLIPATPEFLAMLRRVTEENGILLLFDEVITFRLGYAGAQGRFGVTPDLTTLAKIIGGGFPVGAVAGRADVMAVFDPRNGKADLPHSGTFNANPVTMVAGEATLRLLTPAEFDRLEALGERARAGLTEAFRDAGVEGQVTGLGSLLRIHMTSAPLVDYRSALMTAAQKAALAQVLRSMREDGVFLNDRGVVALSTPMTETEVDTLIETFARALGALKAQHAAA